MPISETDLDLLEEYLDGALDATAIANLQGRLAIDKDLSAELVLSRSQRAVRLAAFKSMEPDAATAEQLVWRIRGAMHDQQQQKQIQPARGWSQWRIARIGSAAAACLVFGFFAGRFTHGTAGIHDLNVSGISQTSPDANVVAARHDDQPAGQFVAVNHTPQISVPVTNEYGQVVAWQAFDNPEQAKNFTEELHHAHGETVPAASGGATKLVDQEQVPF